jgi:DNA-binding NarL/FixJ family response regulator
VPHRVLILEDDAVTAMSLNNALTELGYEVCGHAYSGEGALLMAERTMPDLVVADIRLGGVVDGIEAARRIKEKFGVNVVFTSALMDPATFRRAREVGRFLWKPYSNDFLAKAMAEAMASSH